MTCHKTGTGRATLGRLPLHQSHNRLHGLGKSGLYWKGMKPAMSRWGHPQYLLHLRKNKRHTQMVVKGLMYKLHLVSVHIHSIKKTKLKYVYNFKT